MDQNIRKHRFLEVFGIVVILLALVKCTLPMLTSHDEEIADGQCDSLQVGAEAVAETEAPVEVNEPVQAPTPVEAAEPAAVETPAVQADAAE